MTLGIKIHEAQVTILRELLFKPEAGFADIQKLAGLDSSHFTFHISRLVDQGLIEKTANNNYRLSAKGKEYANTLDTDSNTVERQPKISVIIIGWRDRKTIQKSRESEPEIEFLVQQRLKNPYYGYWGRLGGKIRWGETVLEAAARELLEETGLSAELEYKGLYHKMDYKMNTTEMLEDKFFLLVKACNFTGKLIEDFEGGKNAWLSADELAKQDKVFQGMAETYESASQNGYSFTEKQVYYDLSDY